MNTKHSSQSLRHGFTLMETVIAIGVLAVLLTGFMIVFTPAADGIRKSISSQEADRLLTALSNELVNTRVPAEGTTGFDKAFGWIEKSTGAISSNDAGNPQNALLLFQYRGSANPSDITNGAPTPVDKLRDNGVVKMVGKDYTMVPILRRRSDVTKAELDAAEGPVFLVKCVQLVFDGANSLVVSSNRGQIRNPVPGVDPTGPFTSSSDYPEAVLSFQAEFYLLPTKSHNYISGTPFATFYSRAIKPTFARNLAVRR